MPDGKPPGGGIRAILPNGLTASMKMAGGLAYMPDGSRPRAGSVINTANGSYYQVVPDPGFPGGVKGKKLNPAEFEMSRKLNGGCLKVVETERGIAIYAYVSVSGNKANEIFIDPNTGVSSGGTYKQIALGGIVSSWGGSYNGKPVSVQLVDLTDGGGHYIKACLEKHLKWLTVSMTITPWREAAVR